MHTFIGFYTDFGQSSLTKSQELMVSIYVYDIQYTNSAVRWLSVQIGVEDGNRNYDVDISTRFIFS